MGQYRVAKSIRDLGVATPVEADTATDAAAAYVDENNMEPGDYWVTPVIDPVSVTVEITKQVTAVKKGEEEEKA